VSSPARTLIFVYGTLKRGFNNHHHLSGQVFLGEAQTARGFRLFNLGDYPGMVPDASDWRGVTGEVWSVDPACLARLDKLEGVSEGLYRREMIPMLPPFSDSVVETYIYARSIENRPEVGPGWIG
jgi:gamma-glutamylaminecyclotransferase